MGAGGSGSLGGGKRCGAFLPEKQAFGLEEGGVVQPGGQGTRSRTVETAGRGLGSCLRSCSVCWCLGVWLAKSWECLHGRVLVLFVGRARVAETVLGAVRMLAA